MVDKVAKIEKILPFFREQLKDCRSCPRECGVNRYKQLGYCHSKEKAVFYSYFLHNGEEPPISGDKGSGTIFFSSCNLRCAYCQNYLFSHLQKGRQMSNHELADIMLKLQHQGAVNINLVTPTHFLASIVEALLIAFKKGLQIPIVYNSSGYEKNDILAKLDGIIDIYLLDAKYYSANLAKKLSQAPQYPKFNQQAIYEVYRQLPRVAFNKSGTMEKGVILRHLILPGYITETKQVLAWISRNLAKYDPFVSVMSQFKPYFRAKEAGVSGCLSRQEYQEIASFLSQLEITNGWFQQYQPNDHLAGVYFRSKEP
jgi:putative pyruvate formate lyase activating enzyme